VRRALSH